MSFLKFIKPNRCDLSSVCNRLSTSTTSYFDVSIFLTKVRPAYPPPTTTTFFLGILFTSRSLIVLLTIPATANPTAPTAIFLLFNILIYGKNCEIQRKLSSFHTSMVHSRHSTVFTKRLIQQVSADLQYIPVPFDLPSTYWKTPNPNKTSVVVVLCGFDSF